MCIKRVESYEFAGKLYASEIEAIEAAITEIGAKLLKNHHSCMGVGLMEHRKTILPLLIRYDAIHGPSATDSEGTSEKSAGEPMQQYQETRRVVFDEIRDAYRAAPHEVLVKALSHMAFCGYSTLDEFLKAATSGHILQLQMILGLRNDEDN